MVDLIRKRPVARLSVLVWLSLVRGLKASGVGNQQLANLYGCNVDLTTLSSPSSSRVAGSGIGPSTTHLLDSYFVLMKFSIFLAVVQHLVAQSPVAFHLRFGGYMSGSQLRLPISMNRELFIQSRHYDSIADLFALAFPHLSTLCNCSSVQASKSTDLTRLMCVPIPRCIPEQLRPIIRGRTVREAQVQRYTECRQISPSSSLPILDLFRHAIVSDRSSKGSRFLREITHTLVPFAVRTALVAFEL